jgi:hypothetical protein
LASASLFHHIHLLVCKQCPTFRSNGDETVWQTYTKLCQASLSLVQVPNELKMYIFWDDIFMVLGMQCFLLYGCYHMLILFTLFHLVGHFL